MANFQSVSTKLPSEVVHALRPLMARDPLPAEDLVAMVRRFQEKVHHLGSSGVFVNVGTADRLADKLEDLIAVANTEMPSYERGLVQAAVLYFVDEDDQQADLQSSFGFDDDALVVDAVDKLIRELRDS